VVKGDKELVWVIDNSNVLIADIAFSIFFIIAWFLWFRKDWIAFSFILFYISMIPIWHYYH
jgi:hypothetical protein